MWNNKFEPPFVTLSIDHVFSKSKYDAIIYPSHILILKKFINLFIRCGKSNKALYFFPLYMKNGFSESIPSWLYHKHFDYLCLDHMLQVAHQHLFHSICLDILSIMLLCHLLSYTAQIAFLHIFTAYTARCLLIIFHWIYGRRPFYYTHRQKKFGSNANPMSLQQIYLHIQGSQIIYRCDKYSLFFVFAIKIICNKCKIFINMQICLL